MSRLKERREASDLSQSQLAERAALSVRTLQHYEQGSLDINKAATDTVRRLARVLRCSVDEILEPEPVEEAPAAEPAPDIVQETNPET